LMPLLNKTLPWPGPLSHHQRPKHPNEIDWG
jgi:hypothetical protein